MGLDTIHILLLELFSRATCSLPVIPCSRGFELYDTVLCGSAKLCCSSCLSLLLRLETHRRVSGLLTLGFVNYTKLIKRQFLFGFLQFLPLMFLAL